MKRILSKASCLDPLLVLGIVSYIVVLMTIVVFVKTGSKANHVYVSSAKELTQLFAERQYHWPPTAEVPLIVIARFPEDMGELDSEDRKSVFFRALLPLIIEENAAIKQERALLLKIVGQDQIQGQNLVELNKLAKQYGLDGDVTDRQVQLKLKRRIDIIPPALVLAQAANESAWGTSRFAVEANNIFGEWTYKKADGLLPKARQDGKKHHVRKFKDLRSSVRSYMNNLNRGHAYQSLRRMRADMRKKSTPFQAKDLAAGLKSYSSRGDEYVKEIRTMIQQNRLDMVDYQATN